VKYRVGESEPWSLGGFRYADVLAIDGNSVWVVDQAYVDPDSVRSFALNIPSWSSGRGRYPGRFLFSPIPTEFYSSALSDLMGLSVTPSRNYRFAPFAMIRGAGHATSKVFVTPHSDAFCDYVAVIYLSTESDMPRTPAGTSFWRHLPTGLSGPPRDWTTKRIKAELSGAREKDWLQLFTVQLQYNRMVVFPANLFHRIELPGATTVNWTRLSQNIYLDLAAGGQR
jgi:hypothetical protein